MEHLMCAGLYSECFMWIILFNLHYKPHVIVTNIIPILQVGNGKKIKGLV